MARAKTLLGAAAVSAAIDRLAAAVVSAAPKVEELALVGIHTRGIPLARRIAGRIEQECGAKPRIGELDISLYRDDLARGGDRPVVRRTSIDFALEPHVLVLVDDVLFTGRTVRAALDALTDLGRPRAIRLAVLVDRGGRELPIQPDFVAERLAVPPDHVVEVRLSEVDRGDDRVISVPWPSEEGARGGEEARR